MRRANCCQGPRFGNKHNILGSGIYLKGVEREKRKNEIPPPMIDIWSRLETWEIPRTDDRAGAPDFLLAITHQLPNW